VRSLYASINNILPKPISNHRNVKGSNKKKKNGDLYEKNNKRQKKKKKPLWEFTLIPVTSHSKSLIALYLFIFIIIGVENSVRK
jgi:hypothetical protein